MISSKTIMKFPIEVAKNNNLAVDKTDLSALRWLSTWRRNQHFLDKDYGFPGMSLYHELLDRDNLSPLLLMYQITVNKYCPRFIVKSMKVVRKKTRDMEYRRGVILYVTVAISDKAGKQIIQGLDLSEL